MANELWEQSDPNNHLVQPQALKQDPACPNVPHIKLMITLVKQYCREQKEHLIVLFKIRDIIKDMFAVEYHSD